MNSESANDTGRSGNRRLFIKSTILAAGVGFAHKTWAEAGVGALRPVFDSYFEAWHGSDPQKVLAFLSDDVVINLVGDAGTLKGKQAVGDKWIIPTMKQFPGNVHHVQGYFEADDHAVIEWVFTGVDAATHKEASFPGCSIYWVKGGLITRGHIYTIGC